MAFNSPSSSGSSSAFMPSLTSAMAQFAQELEKEFRKSSSVVEGLKRQCQSLQAQVSTMGQKIHYLENTIEAQNVRIAKMEDFQMKPVSKRARVRSRSRSKETARSKNWRELMNAANAGRNPLTGLKRSVGSVDLDNPDARGQSKTFLNPMVSSLKPMMSGSTGSGMNVSNKVAVTVESKSTAGVSMATNHGPNKSVDDMGPEAAKRMCFTLNTKFYAIEEIKRKIHLNLKEDIAIRQVALNHDNVGVKTLERWWADREKIRRNWIENPDARNKKALRKSNATATDLSDSEDDSWLFDIKDDSP